MSINYNYNVINLDLTNGLNNELFEYTGESIYYSSGTQQIRIKLEDSSNDWIELNPKQRIVAPFSKFWIDADSYAETITLFVSMPASIKLEGEEVDVDTVNQVSNIQNNERVTHCAYGHVTIGTSATLIRNADSGRKSLLIRNISDSNNCHIGTNSGVTTTNGFILYPHDAISFDHYTGDVYGVSSVSLSVCFLEEKV